MELRSITLGDVLAAGGYLLFGTVGMAVLTVGLLAVAEPVRPAVYDALYLAVGPWSATTAASVLSFALATLPAAGLVTLAAEFSAGRSHLAAVAGGLAALIVVLLAGLTVAAYFGAGGLPSAAAAFGAFAVSVPLWLRHVGAWPHGVTAFAGAVPVLVLSLLLLGFGLGWGGGYDVVAEEVPAGAVDGSAATFDDAPGLRDDLLSPSGEEPSAYCEQDDGRRVCRLPLRGYDQEARAARFLAQYGVRCPFRGARSSPGERESFVAEHDGTYYRISCQAYGD